MRFCPAAPERSSAQLRMDSGGNGTVARAWLVASDTAPAIANPADFQGSYCLNGYFYADDPYADPKKRFAAEGDIRVPSKTPFFADAMWVDCWPLQTDLPPTDLYNGELSQWGLTRVALPRHRALPSAATRNYSA